MRSQRWVLISRDDMRNRDSCPLTCIALLSQAAGVPCLEVRINHFTCVRPDNIKEEPAEEEEECDCCNGGENDGRRRLLW